MATGYKDLPGMTSLLTGGAGKIGATGVLSTVLGTAGKFLPYAGPVLLGAQFVASLIGRGRKQASAWTSSVQDPFGERIKSIIDPIDAAAKAGTLTYEQASQALGQYEDEVSALESAATQFEGLGGQQKKVIQQFRAQFAQPGYLADWRKSLEGHVNALKPPERTPPGEAPSFDTILASVGDTPEAHARRRAEQERKRMAVGGRRSTILGGASSNPTTSRRTLMGY